MLYECEERKSLMFSHLHGSLQDKLPAHQLKGQSITHIFIKMPQKIEIRKDNILTIKWLASERNELLLPYQGKSGSLAGYITETFFSASRWIQWMLRYLPK